MPALWFFMPWVFVLMLTGCTEPVLAAKLFEGWGMGVVYLMLAASAIVCALLVFVICQGIKSLLHCAHLALQDHDRLSGRSRRAQP